MFCDLVGSTALASRLDQRAAGEEKTADQRNQDNQWERKDAEEHLQNALSDFQQAQSLARTLERVAYEHVRREQNKDADRLANLAMDEGAKP